MSVSAACSMIDKRERVSEDEVARFLTQIDCTCCKKRVHSCDNDDDVRRLRI